MSKQLAPEQHLANTYVGTPYYMSPEIVSDLSYTHKSDIWSLGCIIYELCNLSPPFNAKTQWSLIDKIKSGKYPPIPNLFSPELRRVIDMCLRTDSRQRPDTGELLEMDIFKTLRKERELILYDRELQSKETRLRLEEQQLRGRLVELQHEERQLHGKALEMQRAFDTKTSQLQSQIDAQLRREWEIRAQQEIDRQVDLRVEERVERELERRIQEQVDVRVHTELMRKLKEYDLANRHSQDQLHTPPPTLTGSLGSSGASSGFSVSESSPPHGHYSRLIPDSPCDITMASPTAATPYRHNNHYHYNPHPHLEDAPKFTQMLQENSQQQQHASSLMPPPPITPIRSHAFSAPMLQDISNEPNTVVQAESSKATIKRATSAYPSSPTRVRRQGLQRAGTTGLLFGQPDKAFAIGGRSNSFDEAAAREADGGGSMARARSIVEITRMKRITKPAPKWDQESDDAPSPYLKRNTRRPRY